MRTLIYKLIYNNLINCFLRSTAKSLNRSVKTNLRFPISGTITFNVNEKKVKMATNQTGFVAYKIFWEGYENYEFTNILSHLVKKSSCILDVGANTGYFSLLSSAINPDITIHAFEPSKGPFTFLTHNIALNKFQNITTHKLALSDREGTIEFYDVVNPKYSYLEHYLDGANSFFNNFGTQKTNNYNVSTTTLDLFCSKNNIDKIDIIKLDTECTEHIIIKHGHQAITQFQPIIISEVYETIEVELAEFMKKHNYLMFHYSEGLLHPFTDFSTVPDTIPRNFFFSPPGKLSLIKDFIQDYKQ